MKLSLFSVHIFYYLLLLCRADNQNATLDNNINQNLTEEDSLQSERVLNPTNNSFSIEVEDRRENATDTKKSAKPTTLSIESSQSIILKTDPPKINGDNCMYDEIYEDCTKPNLIECTCPSKEEDSTICTKFGTITTHDYDGSCHYNIPVEEDEKLLIYFSKNNVSNLSSSCWIKLKGQTFDKDDLLGQENVFTSTEDLNIDTMKKNELCSWKLNYRIEKREETHARDLSCDGGLITPPRDALCLQNYAPRTSATWKVSSKKDKCRMQFNITYLDIGNSFYFDNATVKEFLGDNLDYLVIGVGNGSKQEIGPQDTVFYGYIEEPFVHKVNSCSSYVRFVSDMHYPQVPQGFEIRYKILEITETEPPVEERLPPLPFGFMVDTWVALNGVGGTNVSENDIKKGLAKMANRYLRDRNFDANVTSDDIYILAISECHLVYCQVSCMAFNFIIHYSINGTWLFRRHILNQMLLLYHEQKFFGEEVQLCVEFYETTWKAMGMLVVILGMTGALMAVVCCIIKDRQYEFRARNPFNRWRSSSTRSIESLSSQTTFKSYTVPLPGFGNDFAWYPPTEKKKEVKNDFEQYFSNNKSENPYPGEEKEENVAADADADASYTNKTFAVEEDEMDVYSRPNAIMESDTDDSDFEPYFKSGVFHVSGMDTGESRM